MKGWRNILLAKITLLHTKSEDKKPRVKTFTISHHPDPVFDLLGQLLALAVADGVFAASIQDVKVIYDYPIPSYLLGEPLKYKPKNLDQPVIHQPLDGSSNILQLHHESWEGDVLEAPSDLTKHLPPSAVALDMVLDEVLDKASCSLLLNADSTAPTELPDHLQAQFDNDLEIQELVDENIELWEAIKRLGYRTVLSAKGKTPLYHEKMKKLRELSRQKAALREQLMEQARREHFRNAPTERLNAFLGGSDEGDKRRRPLPMAPPPPPNLLIKERRGFMELIHWRTSDLSDNEIYKWQCLSMSLWVEMQGWKEARQVSKLRK
ncbi:hypothetical protein LOZ58_005995 [Ophidiomyces ophidiicola]|nr:hypothetical protein LOZ58_005995 [Ophidiomyces ophidiicola]